MLRNFKEISKVRFLITSNDFLDEGELICETNYDHEDLAKKIKEFFKTHFKLNIKVSLTKCGSIKNDGLLRIKATKIECFMRKKTIRVKNLSCKRNYKLIFKNISFSLEQGSVIFINGNNGSGKTSLLLALWDVTMGN